MSDMRTGGVGGGQVGRAQTQETGAVLGERSVQAGEGETRGKAKAAKEGGVVSSQLHLEMREAAESHPSELGADFGLLHRHALRQEQLEGMKANCEAAEGEIASAREELERLDNPQELMEELEASVGELKDEIGGLKQDIRRYNPLSGLKSHEAEAMYRKHGVENLEGLRVAIERKLERASGDQAQKLERVLVDISQMPKLEDLEAQLGELQGALEEQQGELATLQDSDGGISALRNNAEAKLRNAEAELADAELELCNEVRAHKGLDEAISIDDAKKYVDTEHPAELAGMRKAFGKTANKLEGVSIDLGVLGGNRGFFAKFAALLAALFGRARG